MILIKIKGNMKKAIWEECRFGPGQSGTVMVAGQAGRDRHVLRLTMMMMMTMMVMMMMMTPLMMVVVVIMVAELCFLLLHFKMLPFPN